jgi:small subunit ribosomal protein S9
MSEQNNSPLIDPEILNKKPEVSDVQSVETQVIDRKPATPDAGGFVWGTGRRKASVARVRIRPGEGKVMINDREVGKYFCKPQDQNAVWAPLKSLNVTKNFDIYANVNGGGTTGQAGAVLLGIARALANYDPSLIPQLRDGGYLTRDGRAVERKKYGQRGARRRFQFSKR